MNTPWVALQLTTYCTKHDDPYVQIQERLLIPVRAEERETILAFVRRVREATTKFEIKEI